MDLCGYSYIAPLKLGETSRYVSTSVVNYVWRTRKNLVVGDATQEDPYAR